MAAWIPYMSAWMSIVDVLIIDKFHCPMGTKLISTTDHKLVSCPHLIRYRSNVTSHLLNGIFLESRHSILFSQQVLAQILLEQRTRLVELDD